MCEQKCKNVSACGIIITIVIITSIAIFIAVVVIAISIGNHTVSSSIWN